MEPTDCAAGRDLLRAGLSDDELNVVAAGIEALCLGRALPPSEIWPENPELATDVLGSLAEAGRAEIDKQGRLVGVHGFTLRETRHAFVHNGVRHHTWCAFDSIGIPAAFGIDAEAATDCPACGRVVTVRIEAGEPDVTGPDTAELVVWLPQPAGTSDLMGQFCASADIYCSRAHLEERIDTAATAGSALSLPAAAEVGRATWADVEGITTTCLIPGMGRIS